MCLFLHSFRFEFFERNSHPLFYIGYNKYYCSKTLTHFSMGTNCSITNPKFFFRTDIHDRNNNGMIIMEL